ncbi:MAG TPA: DUF5677 domain-containing protein [Arthrobacter sp.]|nr:DUF5677 domain-containing protein [Arthrobacter sp.]
MATPHLTPPNIEAWLKFIEERERRLQDTDSFEVAAEHQMEFQTVYGICAQAMRYAGAYVVLHRVGRSREAVAVARQALEHALTAQWAHFDETGPVQLIDGYHHTRERAFRVVMEFLNTPRDEIDAALESTTSKGKKLLRVTNMIEKIDFNAMFTTAYMQQSQIVHVTSETVTAFLDLDDEKQFTILSEATDPHERQTARFTAMAAMFASWVLESLRVDTPGLAELDQLSDALALPLNIRD